MQKQTMIKMKQGTDTKDIYSAKNKPCIHVDPLTSRETCEYYDNIKYQ